MDPRKRQLKISGVIACFFFALDIIFFLFAYFYVKDAGVEAGLGIGILLGFLMFSQLIIAVPVACLNVVLSIMRFRTLDNIDKLFLVVSILVIAVVVFVFYEEYCADSWPNISNIPFCKYLIKG